MAKYELLICVADEADLASGHKRKKEGDILAIKPYPWNWGRKEIDEGLVVIVNINRAFDVLDLAINQSLFREIATGRIVTDEQQFLETDPKQGGTKRFDEFEFYAKKRFRFALGKIRQRLSDLDLTKVRDKLKVYQPFKSSKQLRQKFTGIKGNRFLNRLDVDSISSQAGEDQEFTIDLETIPPVIYDKMTKQLVKM